MIPRKGASSLRSQHTPPKWLRRLDFGIAGKALKGKMEKHEKQIG
jgi:hypothetical protein